MALPRDLKRALDGYLSYRRPDSRYASFDYCYNYFQGFRRSGRLTRLADPANTQRSCLELGFFLASWGMMRGSSDLRNKSCRYLCPLISTIASAPSDLWDLDVSVYDDNTWDLLNGFREKILLAMQGLRGVPSDILVTKVMLGVFGNVPAFDRNFTAGFGSSTFGPKAIRRIRDFFINYKTELSEIQIPTLAFDGSDTEIHYPIAKIVDMIFFSLGEQAD